MFGHSRGSLNWPLPAGQIVKCVTFDEHPTAAGHKCYHGSPDSKTSAWYGARKLAGSAAESLGNTTWWTAPRGFGGRTESECGDRPRRQAMILRSTVPATSVSR